MVESREREEIKAGLKRKFDQWPEIRSYLVTAHQAAAVEPAIQPTLDQWFDDAIGNMQEGLDRAGRFDPSTRRIRCSLAFGELEFFSRRWFRLGWVIDRDAALELMTDS